MKITKNISICFYFFYTRESNYFSLVINYLKINALKGEKTILSEQKNSFSLNSQYRNN